MKKLIMTAIAVFSMVTFADTTDVYDFKMSAKVPYLKNGIRQYSGQTLKGYLYLTWSDDALVDVSAEVINTKTKVKHYMDFSDGLYNLMGKSTKKIYRSIPTFSLTGCDIETEANESHELIKNLTLAGTGSLTYIKGTGCGMCGAGTADCNKLYTLNGNFVGIMDCECPENENWDHTVEAAQCDVFKDNDTVVRSHDAAVWGTWTAKWNKKITENL